MKLVGVVLIAIWALVAPVAAMAGEELLTIHADGKTLSFDRESLEDIGESTVETSTIWTEGVQKFQGVSLSGLLSHAGIHSGTLKAIALNEYSVEIPLDDPTTSSAIVAFARNGKDMGVRDNGPLWLIYPFDSDPALQSEVIYSRSIWQLIRFELLP